MDNVKTINYLMTMMRYYMKMKRQNIDTFEQNKIDEMIKETSKQLSSEFNLLQSVKDYDMIRYETDNYKGFDLLDKIMSLVELIRHCEYVADSLALDYRTELEQLLFKVVE